MKQLNFSFDETVSASETPPDVSPRINGDNIEILRVNDTNENRSKTVGQGGTKFQEYKDFKPVKRRKKYSKEFMDLLNSNEEDHQDNIVCHQEISFETSEVRANPIPHSPP